MGNILTRRGDPDLAREKYERAVEIRREVGVPPARLLCEFALFHIENHRYVGDAEWHDDDREADLEAALHLIETS